MSRSLIRSLLVVLLFSALSSLPLSAGGDHWPIDRAHSRVTFTVTKWGFAEVEGRFRDFTGAIAYNAVRPEFSHIDWTIRLTTVDSGDPQRDAALQRPEYFNTARYPEMRFVSESVRKVGAQDIDVTGTLTIKGVSKPLTTRVTYGGRHVVPKEGTFDTFTTAFTINRYDFGVVGGSLLGPAISKDVKISLLAVAKQPAR